MARNYEPIEILDYNLDKLKSLQKAVKLAKDSGGEQLYRIEIDGLTVVQKNSDPNQFFAYRDYIEPHHKKMIVEMYKGKGRYGDLYQFRLQKEGSQKNDNQIVSELSGIIHSKMEEMQQPVEGMTTSEFHKMQLQHQEQLAGFQQKLDQALYQSQINDLQRDLKLAERQLSEATSKLQSVSTEFEEYKENSDKRVEKDQKEVKELEERIEEYERIMKVSPEYAPVIAGIGAFTQGLFKEQIAKKPDGFLAGLVKSLKLTEGEDEGEQQQLPAAQQQQQVAKAQYKPAETQQKNEQWLEQLMQQCTPEQISEGAQMIKFLQDEYPQRYEEVIGLLSYIAHNPGVHEFVAEIIVQHQQDNQNKPKTENEHVHKTETTAV